MAQRVVSDGSRRAEEGADNVSAETGRAFLRTWLESLELDLEPRSWVRAMQADEFSHSDLHRRACRTHERRLRTVVEDFLATISKQDGYAQVGRALFNACAPIIPYIPATAFLAHEAAKLASRDEEHRRVALVIDGAGSMHGVAHTIERIREHGVPGWEVDVIGTDPMVDRRLPAVAEFELPFYPGLHVGVPSVPQLVQALAEGRYDVVHVVSPGPAGIAAAVSAQIAGVPLVAAITPSWLRMSGSVQTTRRSRPPCARPSVTFTDGVMQSFRRAPLRISR